MTKHPKWREEQLSSFIRGIYEFRKEFEQAVFEDLGRSPNASFIMEIMPLVLAAEHDLKHLRSYMDFVPE